MSESPAPSAAPAPEVRENNVAALSVSASVETAPTVLDGASSAAIVLNRDDPASSLVLGAASAGGIEIYTLNGERLGTESRRPATLVDVHYNFPLSGELVTLVLAFDPSTSELVPYTLSDDGNSLQQISAAPFLAETEIEGLCLYRSPLSGNFYAFAAGGGYIQQWELFEQDGAVAGRLIRNLPVGLGGAQCLVDDRASTLYYSQETVGVWHLNAEPESEAEPVAIDLVQPMGRFTGDVKGLGLIEHADGSGYLLVSDADVSLVQVYATPGHQHVATFGVEAGDTDAVEEAEGFSASSFGISDVFPDGLLILADENNEGEHSNFKLVSWRTVAEAHGLELADAYNPTAPVQPAAVTVSASVETEPVTGYGDAADDPAIWVHPENPDLSLIIGTQKQRGMNVYGLDGALLQTVADGRINNVDLRYDFPLGDQNLDILTASNRSNDSIGIYAVDPESRTLYSVSDGVIPTGMIDPYGLCMYRSYQSGNYYVIINDTDGVVKQWLLTDTGNQSIGAELVREFSVGSQTEGCVADDEMATLYVGEEDVGIWKYSAEPEDDPTRTMVDGTEEGNLTDDVEGLAIYFGPNGSGYLVASNQGADSYAVYERAGDNRFVGIFHVTGDRESGIDGVSETDGLDVTSANLGPGFPNGLFVAQDGRNISPSDRQNFKLVPWERIAAAMNLEVYSGYDPRMK